MVSRVILNHCNGEQATQITPYVFKYDPVNNTYFPNSCTIMPQGTMHGGPPSSLLLFEAIKALNEANENPSTDQWNIVKFTAVCGPTRIQFVIFPFHRPDIPSFCNTSHGVE